MAAAASKSPSVELEVGDRTVRISNPDRVYFPSSRKCGWQPHMN